MPKFDLMFWDTLFVAKAALWFLEIEEESFGLEMRLRDEHGAGRVKFFLLDELVVVEF